MFLFLPSVFWAFLCLTLLPFAVEIAPAEHAAAAVLSALLHSSSAKQQINSVASRSEG